ncbi:MAG: hypothetical protein A3B68_04970 [Candidatus Melainabacteria bacterium RIFCSPHIGHO2_02_FULL_34_12]|nr:MAG: hypothetical protein A3B68_04970 [Candidatus Melainabacteria bacterium RIFCSPHIGHO2_02_FULL_34_12]
MRRFFIVCLVVLLSDFSQAFAAESISPLLPQLQENLLELDNARSELEKASPRARPITKRINFLIKRINLVVTFGFPAKCEKKTSENIIRLKRQLTKLEMKKCKSKNSEIILRNRDLKFTFKCITEDIINDYLPRLQESLENVKSVFLIDENNNDMPDICEGEEL